MSSSGGRLAVPFPRGQLLDDGRVNVDVFAADRAMPSRTRTGSYAHVLSGVDRDDGDALPPGRQLASVRCMWGGSYGRFSVVRQLRGPASSISASMTEPLAWA